MAIVTRSLFQARSIAMLGMAGGYPLEGLWWFGVRSLMALR